MATIRKLVRPVRPVSMPFLATEGRAEGRTAERLCVSVDRMEDARAAALLHGDLIGMLHAEAAAHPLLSAEEELALARRVKAGDREARAQFISANIRLVGSIARYYVRVPTAASADARERRSHSGKRHDGLEIEDVMAEGLVGLVRAVDRFDPEKGFKFSTYASWWIRQAISRGVADTGYAIRAPVYQRTLERRVQRLRHEFIAAHGRQPTLDELARLADETPDTVADVLNLAHVIASLDQPLPSVALGTGHRNNEGDPRTLDDILPDTTASEALERVEAAADAVGAPDSVLVIMARLEKRHPREMLILRRRIIGGEGLETIGRDLHVSRERVRQLQEKGARYVRAERARVRRERSKLATSKTSERDRGEAAG